MKPTRKKNYRRDIEYFLNSTGDIGLFKNRYGNYKNNDRGHCIFLKSTRDMRDTPPPPNPPSRALQVPDVPVGLQCVGGIDGCLPGCNIPVPEMAPPEDDTGERDPFIWPCRGYTSLYSTRPFLVALEQTTQRFGVGKTSNKFFQCFHNHEKGP